MSAAAPPPPLRIERIADEPAFCHLGTLGAAIEVDLRYAGVNNFAGRVLYGGFDCAWLRSEAAQGLLQAAQWLRHRHPGWRLRVLDALRPHRVQQAIWRDVVGTPQQAYFADPRVGSIHSYGMAVDVTLVDEHGVEVDMGSGFDEMQDLSHPALHADLLAAGRLQPQQVGHREILRQAMAEGGFAGIPNEWWHFDCGRRDQVRRELPRVD